MKYLLFVFLLISLSNCATYYKVLSKETHDKYSINFSYLTKSKNKENLIYIHVKSKEKDTTSYYQFYANKVTLQKLFNRTSFQYVLNIDNNVRESLSNIDRFILQKVRIISDSLNFPIEQSKLNNSKFIRIK